MHIDFEVLAQRQPCAIDFGFLFHKEILPRHRDELLNWLYKLNEKFSSSGDLEAFFQAVSVVDLVCSRRDVLLHEFQLVGAASFWVASKNCLSEFPSAKELTYLGSGAFTCIELFEMERIILFTIDWQIQLTTPYTVLALVFCELCEMGMSEDLFSVTKQVLVMMQRDLGIADQSPILQGIAAATATFLCYGMERLAVEGVKFAKDWNIEQDSLRSLVMELQPFFKKKFLWLENK